MRISDWSSDVCSSDLISHANWSPIHGRRGQIERNVRVVDVSDAGDWSLVRVWYAPIGDLGTRTNPVQGFLYPGADDDEPVWAESGWKPGNGLALVAASLGNELGSGFRVARILVGGIFEPGLDRKGTRLNSSQ